MPAPPDRAYRTGTAHGYDLFVWECAPEGRVAIWRYSAEMRRDPARKDVGPCGAPLPVERKILRAAQIRVLPPSAWGGGEAGD